MESSKLGCERFWRASGCFLGGDSFDYVNLKPIPTYFTYLMINEDSVIIVKWEDMECMIIPFVSIHIGHRDGLYTYDYPTELQYDQGVEKLFDLLTEKK